MYIRPLIFALVTTAIALVPFGVRAQSVSLTVQFLGLSNNDGRVYVSLYNTPQGYPTDAAKAIRKTSVPIHNRNASVTFADLARGTYATAAFHDENSNGKLDFNFLGIPSEPAAASNDATGFMGPPSFKDAKFVLRTDTTIAIHLP